MNIYDFEVTEMDGTVSTLAKYKGKIMLIVNTASKCGFTPQFEGLEALYEDYQAKGLVVLGFPCNQFLAQDPKSNEAILNFCQKNYGVTFPMHEKVKVKGRDADPLFIYLREQTNHEKINWNFNKYLIDQKGEVKAHYESKVTPAEIAPVIEKLI